MVTHTMTTFAQTDWAKQTIDNNLCHKKLLAPTDWAALIIK